MVETVPVFCIRQELSPAGRRRSRRGESTHDGRLPCRNRGASDRSTLASKTMVLTWGQLLLGGLVLYLGAEWLVKGAAGLAQAFGLRPLVIGLTVVAYGTSAPELTVGVSAALDGRGAIAFGNSIGSNIANLGLIFGMTVLIAPPRVDGGLIRRELPALLLSTAV